MPQQQHQEQQQQPSEVQLILDDALTDLEALVDRYLPGTSGDGGFAGRMMAAIEQVGASASKSIGGGLAEVVVPDIPGSGRQPVRSRSNASSRSRTSQQYYSESSVEVSYEYDERTDDSAYDTHDARSDSSSAASASEELKPVAAVVVRNKDKSKSKSRAGHKDELMDQTIETAANTTVDALDTSYFAQDDDDNEEVEPASTPSNKVQALDLGMDMDMDETAAIDGPLPESPRRKAEREADEAAERLAHRSYFSKRSSFDQLIDEGAHHHDEANVISQTNTNTNTNPNPRPAPSEPTNGKTVADKTQHELVQQYRLEKKQQMVAAKGTTAPDDECVLDAGVERRREERRAEERRRLAAVAEHRRRVAHNAQKLREANAAAAAAAAEAGTPPRGLHASDNGESTDDSSLADDLQSLVVTDLD